MRRPNPDVASLQATYSTRPGYLAVLVSARPGYTDEYTLFERLDRLLQECEERGLRMAVVQGGADGADAIAREWVLHNKDIGSRVRGLTSRNLAYRPRDRRCLG